MQESHALAPLTPPEPDAEIGTLVREVSLGLLGSRAPAFETSVDYSTDEGKALAAVMRMGKHTPLSEIIGTEITLQHVLGHVVNIADKDGVEVPSPRLVVLTTDGQMFQATSMGILDSLKTLVQLYGPPASWTKGVRVKVQQVGTRQGWKTLLLVPVLSALPAKEPARK